jgi:hypothetical protein
MTEAATESTEQTTATVTSTETTETAAAEKDWQVEAEKWKKLSRDNETKAKANAAAAKRLEEIEAANASETEKAVNAARKEGETVALERANTRLVRAEARAVAAELGFIDPADALGQIDLSEVTVDEDGEVDADAVQARSSATWPSARSTCSSRPATRPQRTPGSAPRAPPWSTEPLRASSAPAWRRPARPSKSRA